MDPDIGRVTHGNTPQADLAEAAQAVDLKRSWKGAKLLKGLRLGAGLAAPKLPGRKAEMCPATKWSLSQVSESAGLSRVPPPSHCHTSRMFRPEDQAVGLTPAGSVGASMGPIVSMGGGKCFFVLVSLCEKNNLPTQVQW